MRAQTNLARPLVGVYGVVLVLCLALLAACGQTIAPGADQGTLAGHVVAGPTCPVQSATNPCADKPVAHRAVTIETPTGSTVATATTDAQGDFSVELAPGAYVVHVAILPGQVGMRQSSPGTAQVVAGQTVSITIELDTGIR